MSRREGPDGRDPRSQGFPCYGNHTPMPEGRGSLSGRNAHGKWTVCQTCRLRIEYIPSYGAKGTYRQAGPLAPDVSTVMTQVKDHVKDHPQSRENLNAKTVSILGAEESSRTRLQKLENEKTKALANPKHRPQADPKKTDVIEVSEGPIEVPEENMKSHASKKLQKRGNEVDAENAESQEWSVVPHQASPGQ